MNLMITLVWNKFSISVGFIIRILPTYALLRETQMPLIFIFKARIKFYSFLLDERYTLAACFICWLANNTLTWNLKKKRKSSLTHSLQAKSLGMLQSCFALKTIATSYRAKRKNAIDLSFIMFLSLSGTQRYFFLKHLSFLAGVLELRAPLSIADACSSQWGMKTKTPEEIIWNWRKYHLFFSALCKDIITSVPILYPAKSSPACTSKKEEVVCFAANSMFMPKLQGVM